MSNNVKQILRGKSAEVLTIGPEGTAADAMAVMVERNIGALPVVESGRLLGIVSERDLLRRVMVKGAALGAVRVRDIMTSGVFTVEAGHDIGHCMELMTERRIRHLPVVEGDALVGLLSIGDVVRAMLQEQQATIEQLEMYIRS